MSNNEIIRELLERIYQTDNADDMKRLTGACIAILDAAEPIYADTCDGRTDEDD